VIKTFQQARWTCIWAALLFACIAAAQDGILHIKIVAGDGGTYAPGAHAGKPVSVEVTDGKGQRVAGARVSFQVPEQGPGGLFTNGLRTDLATTDANGRATVRGLQLNRVPGSFPVRITAATDQGRAGTIAKLSISGSAGTIESANRTAPPTAVKTEPAPVVQPAPKQPAPDVPKTVMPGATSTVTVRAAAPVLQAALDPKASAPPPGTVPTIIVTQKASKPAAEIGGSGSHKKWIWIGLLAAGGAGAAFATSSLSHGGASSAAGAAAALPVLSIGSPTITIGKP